MKAVVLTEPVVINEPYGTSDGTQYLYLIQLSHRRLSCEGWLRLYYNDYIKYNLSVDDVIDVEMLIDYDGELNYNNRVRFYIKKKIQTK